MMYQDPHVYAATTGGVRGVSGGVRVSTLEHNRGAADQCQWSPMVAVPNHTDSAIVPHNGHRWTPYQRPFQFPPLGPPGSLGALRVDSIRKYEGCIPRFRIQLFGTETVYFDALQQTMASVNCCVDRLMQPRIPEPASSNLKLADIFSFLHHGDGDGRWWLTLR